MLADLDAREEEPVVRPNSAFQVSKLLIPATPKTTKHVRMTKPKISALRYEIRREMRDSISPSIAPRLLSGATVSEQRLAGAEEARQNGDGQRALARRVHRLGRGLNYPLLPIHEAARYWDVDQIQELISKGVNPDALCRRE